MKNRENKRTGESTKMSVPWEEIASRMTEALLAAPGVAAMADSGFKLNLLSGGKNLAEGIRVSGKEDSLIFDVYVFARYGTKIPVLAWNLQKELKEVIAGSMTVPIRSINIHIQGVRRAEGDIE